MSPMSRTTAGGQSTAALIGRERRDGAIEDEAAQLELPGHRASDHDGRRVGQPLRRWKRAATLVDLRGEALLEGGLHERRRVATTRFRERRRSHVAQAIPVGKSGEPVGWRLQKGEAEGLGDDVSGQSNQACSAAEARASARRNRSRSLTISASDAYATLGAQSRRRTTTPGTSATTASTGATSTSSPSTRRSTTSARARRSARSSRRTSPRRRRPGRSSSSTIPRSPRAATTTTRG